MTEFWRGRRVLVTGHTGFKGSWLSLWLAGKGARVFGLALPPASPRDLSVALKSADHVDAVLDDIRTPAVCEASIHRAQPDVVFHLAAQALVRPAYADPIGTWSTNVMGTLNLLQALAKAGRPCAVVVATTDKVYENHEWTQAYRESDGLGGHDPYSASKAATEILVASERRSFLSERGIRIATARAGNVIGGGDRSPDRLVPDLVRAFESGKALEVRNPSSVRPWQHVLDPLNGYMMLAQALAAAQPDAEGAFDFGPGPSGHRTVAELVETCRKHWPGPWAHLQEAGAPHEAGLLKLATEKARSLLGWSPRWDFEAAVENTVKAYRAFAAGEDARTVCKDQIAAFEAGGHP
ncbi:MAG: CDP-glucose 4,6-dehydratase [Hyphomicrobiales bacterium]